MDPEEDNNDPNQMDEQPEQPMPEQEQ
jgi:hypothetical protein